jgi:hypothetical protein
MKTTHFKSDKKIKPITSDQPIITTGSLDSDKITTGLLMP